MSERLMLPGLWIYDYEVLKYDWIIVAKSIETEEYFIAHNDPQAVALFEATYDPWLCGFNVKHYDRYIHQGVLNDLPPEEIKQINDYILAGNEGWRCPTLLDCKTRIGYMIDLMDDCQVGLSLKAIEGHLGINIKESDVHFDLDRPLTDAELEDLIVYCKHDVDATERLYDLRKDYLANKLFLGRAKGLSDREALSLTNAKLTAIYLDAQSENHNDERQYKFPSNLKIEYIPTDIIKFFERLFDNTISDEEVFTSKISIQIGECECTLGFGGIHGSIDHLCLSQSPDRLIINMDVASYYPHLMTINGYTSRSIKDPSVYAAMLEKRIRAKKSGDTATANALKLVANTTYGAMLNQYNSLYDALMGRSVCISGQLYLLELAEHLHHDIPDLRVVQLNTDGIMVEFNASDEVKVEDIFEEWEDRTGFELEEDYIHKIFQKDVNNYIEVQTSGKIKTKGGYLVRGIAPAGAFNINNNFPVVSKAVAEYFVNNVEPEMTVNSSRSILDFQIIAKASGKYSRVYQLNGEQQIDVQRCNRVYAAKDPTFGTLYKVHKETGSPARIAGLPEHCLIDNDNTHSIDEIDRDWYINLAKKYISDFIGVEQDSLPKRVIIKKENTKMEESTATKTKAPKEKSPSLPDRNIYQILADIRDEFTEEGMKKTGVNPHAEFKYFQLEDIVPVAQPIIHRNGAIFICSSTGSTVLGELVNLRNPSDRILFSFDGRQIAEPAKFRMNETQSRGAEITYQRRYLYSLMLDITDDDEIESKSAPASSTKVAEKTTTKKPATPEERKTIVKTLTNSDQADELMVKSLRNALTTLLRFDSGKKPFVEGIMQKTENFTKVPRVWCEETIAAVNKLVAQHDDDLPI